ATAPRMRSTSAASAASASGICGVSLMLIEISLQDHLRGDLVAMCAAAASGAIAIQPILRNLRCPSLVDQRDGKPEALAKLAREAPCALGHRVRRAIGMQRQSDNQLARLPFVHQR